MSQLVAEIDNLNALINGIEKEMLKLKQRYAAYPPSPTPPPCLPPLPFSPPTPPPTVGAQLTVTLTLSP